MLEICAYVITARYACYTLNVLLAGAKHVKSLLKMRNKYCDVREVWVEASK
jgi:hypothetical protein